MKQSITCPSCKVSIAVDEALMEAARREVLARERQQQEVRLEKIKETVRQEARDALQAEQRDAMQKLQQQNAQRENSNKELRKQVGELLDNLNQAETARHDAENKAKATLLAEKEEIRQKALAESDEKKRLEIAEYKNKIAALEELAEAAKRRASSSTNQLKGEVLELDLEESLKSEFKDDLIESVPVGMKGADVLQTVRTPQGVVCGTIIWEAKRTKAWQGSWLDKLKNDQREIKAHIAVIVSTALPEEQTSAISLREGVWIAQPALGLILAGLLRRQLLAVQRAQSIDTHRETNAELLYGYITSHEFAQRIEALVETFLTAKQEISKEKTVQQRMWAQREARVDKLLQNTAQIIGDMAGRIGASMPRIKGLEFNDSGGHTPELPPAPDSS